MNAILEFNSFPHPRIDELIESLEKAQLISMQDLSKGYCQVVLVPSTQEKTTFSTTSGHWQYWVLPFGLCGAPAMFQRLMYSTVHLALAPLSLQCSIPGPHHDPLHHLGHLSSPSLGSAVRTLQSQADYQPPGRRIFQPQEKQVAGVQRYPRQPTKIRYMYSLV